MCLTNIQCAVLEDKTCVLEDPTYAVLENQTCAVLLCHVIPDMCCLGRPDMCCLEDHRDLQDLIKALCYQCRARRGLLV